MIDRRTSRGLAVLLFVGGLALTALATQRRAQSNDELEHERFALEVQHIADQIVARLSIFEYGLRGMRGVVQAMGEHGVTRDGIRDYSRSREIDREFTGARGFGFVRRVAADQVDAFVAGARADGKPDFAIRQFTPGDGERDVIQYIEPVERNQIAIGLDIASEATRHAAARASMRTGKPTMTAPITLIQNTFTPMSSFLLLLPIYRTHVPLTTPEEREAACYGWSYVPVASDEVFNAFKLGAGEFALSLYDVTDPGAPTEFFHSLTDPQAGADQLIIALPRTLFGRHWRVEVSALPSFLARLNLTPPIDVALGGAVLSALLAGLLYAFLVTIKRTAQLEAQTARLRMTIDNSSDAIITRNRDGEILTWNAAAERIFGYAARDAIGHQLDLFTVTDDSGASVTGVISVLGDGETVEPFDTQGKRSDGSLVEVSIAAAPITAGGAVTSIALTIRDTSAAKAAERRARELHAALEQQALLRELAHERERLDHILRGTNIGTWEWNLQTGEARINERWAAMLGYTCAELAPITIQTLVRYAQTDDLRVAQDILRRHVNGELAYHECELRMKHRDGHWIWVQNRGRISTRTPDGKPEWMHGTQQDITVSKEAQRRLADSESFLERAGHIAGVGGWQVHLDTGAVEWTSETCRIHEMPLDYRPTLADTMAFNAPESLPQINHAVDTAMETGQGWDLELEIITATGRRRWIRAVGGAELDHGKPVRLIGAVQDITERRVADEALRQATAAAEAASAAKSAFLANMSHEIRTPLNAVIGLSYLLERSALDDEQRAFVSKIQVAGRSLLGVINDVLDLSKIEAGELVIEDAAFDLLELVRELQALFTPQAEAKQLALAVHMASDLPRVVRGDSTRVRQILTNLLSNAIKFTERGSVELKVTCEDRGDEQCTVRYAVCDTGIGIAPDTQVRLFTPFTQADASTTRQFGGTGLGLSIVRRLAQSMGGEAGVHSTLGAGSEFWATLAHVIVDDLAVAMPAAAGMLDVMEVLVAEDDPDQRAAILAMARALGWRAEAVATGDQLIARVSERMAANQPLDAMLVDWRIPGVDGLTALAALATRFGRNRIPAAVLASAHDVQTIKRNPDAALADVILAKPLTSSMLFDAVNTSVVRRGGRSGLMTRPQSYVASLTDVRVLVVDDSDINLEVARRILESASATVRVCLNGREAVEILRGAARDFDVVLMDVQMPVMDGNTAASLIRNELGLSRLPIIALTAGALVAERQRSFDAGMTDFLSKPLDPSILIRTVARHVSRARGMTVTLSPLTVAAAIAAAAVEEPAAAAWPVIEGIDSSDVAPRLNHDRALFTSMLGHLMRELDDLATHLPGGGGSALAPADLVPRLHKLRGSAGTLGAKAVRRLAGEAERVLKESAGSPEAATLIRELGDALAVLMRHARGYLDRQPVAPVIAANKPAVDPRAVQELYELLVQQDLAAIERFRALASPMGAVRGEPWLHDVTDAVDRFDFARAAELIQRAGLTATG